MPEDAPPGAPALPRHRARRILKWVAIGTALTVVLASLGGLLAYRYYFGRIEKVPLQQDGRVPRAAGDAKNFLIVGSDGVRLTDEEKQEVPGARTDTIILLHLSAKQDKALLVSFPRDSYVEIPGHSRDRINASFALGGRDLLIRTLEQLSGIHVDHYVEVNFLGFQRMVDAIGGVEVCTPVAVRDQKAGLNLPAGTSLVRGPTALAYVRARDFDGRADIGRIERQQRFLGSMLRGALSFKVLTNPGKLKGFLDAVTSSLLIDDDLQPGDIRNLVSRVGGFDPAKVTFVTLPIANPGLNVGTGGRNKYVAQIDDAGAQALFAAIKADTGVPGAATPAPGAALTVAPAAIRVRVLNGTPTRGRAAEAAADLAELGFRVQGTADADAADYASSVVRHGPAKADSARTVAAAIPGARVQLDQSLGATLEVVIGADYLGARPVTVTRRPSGAPAPIPTTTAADDPCA